MQCRTHGHVRYGDADDDEDLHNEWNVTEVAVGVLLENLSMERSERSCSMSPIEQTLLSGTVEISPWAADLRIEQKDVSQEWDQKKYYLLFQRRYSALSHRVRAVH